MEMGSGEALDCKEAQEKNVRVLEMFYSLIMVVLHDCMKLPKFT